MRPTVSKAHLPALPAIRVPAAAAPSAAHPASGSGNNQGRAWRPLSVLLLVLQKPHEFVHLFPAVFLPSSQLPSSSIHSRCHTLNVCNEPTTNMHNECPRLKCSSCNGIGAPHDGMRRTLSRLQPAARKLRFPQEEAMLLCFYSHVWFPLLHQVPRCACALHDDAPQKLILPVSG